MRSVASCRACAPSWRSCSSSLIAGGARPLAAQILEDTLATDSLAAPTPSTTPRATSRPIEQEEVRVPVLPQLAPPGPRPALTRIVFTRDSIEWLSGATVGDLLAQVPGVYLWRGGYIGRPEPVNFQGRGATSAEYYLDGVPYVAAGRRQRGGGSRAVLDQLSRPGRGGALARVSSGSTSSPGGTTGSLPARASRSPGATATSPATRATLERRFPSGLGFALAGRLPQLPDRERDEQQLLQYPGLGAGQLHPFAPDSGCSTSSSAPRPSGGPSRSPT